MLSTSLSYAVQPEPPQLEPGQVTVADIRAAYLVSVMRYVNWPQEAEKETLTIGILGESPVYDILSRLPLTPVRGKPINVISLSRSSQIPQVDLLYVSPRASASLDQILSQAHRNAVLAVTEDKSIRDDMMINLVSDRDNRLAFQVNDSRIQSTGINTSRDLLLLRGSELDLVVNHHQLLREMQSLRQEKQLLLNQSNEQQRQIFQLQERIDSLEQTISERDNVLRAQQGTLEDKQQVMESQQNALNELLRELEEQRDLLFAREEQLHVIQDALTESEQALAQKEQELSVKETQLANKEREGDALAQRITANRDILAAQQQQLRDQRAALSEQASLIESRERTIDRQREYLIYILIALLIASILGVLSLTLYVNKRRTASQLMDTLNELHQAQDKLVESEKMAALGNLVAGVAHEVNTPLGVALTATSMLNDRREILVHHVQEGSLTREQLLRFLNQSEESLTLTEKNLSRVARLISNFKQVAVDQMVTERRTIDLGTYIEEIMSALSIELKRAHIEYRIDIQEEIEMDTIPGAMAQIMTNLVTNSIRHGYSTDEHAEHKGTISISARRADGNNVQLSFCDDGAGMNEATLQKIFEPFFTTKRNQGGTGLGMPIVYNLVRQQLKGDITVTSTPGAGTCFELILPRHLRLQD
ncbi:YfiR/HmsC family protein [Aliidiomarina minuta]|nr:YfiR/HmsC family protein [Aliidiomarina minuta]